MDGQLLRKLREEKGESRFKLAVAVGTTPDTIQKLENGDTQNPRVPLLKSLAEHFGVTTDFLLGMTAEK